MNLVARERVNTAIFLGAFVALTLLVIMALSRCIVEPAHAADVPTINAADVTTSVYGPVSGGDHFTASYSITTTTVNVTDTDSPTNASDVVATYRVKNTHASQFVCLKVVTRTSSQTCATACGAVGAGALTCTGSGGADGLFLGAGEVTNPPVVVRGDSCLCAEASAAATTYNVSRVSRRPT